MIDTYSPNPEIYTVKMKSSLFTAFCGFAMHVDQNKPAQGPRAVLLPHASPFSANTNHFRNAEHCQQAAIPLDN